MQLHANHDWPKRSAAILERGVEVNAAAADGTTALHLAAAAGFRESCRVLLQHGADRGQKNAAGATAIDAAKGGGHDQLAARVVSRVLVPWGGEKSATPGRHQSAAAASP